MDWEKIIWAVALLMLIVFLWPRAKAMLEHSAQETERDWMGFILPVAAVIGFVILLMAIV